MLHMIVKMHRLVHLRIYRLSTSELSIMQITDDEVKPISRAIQNHQITMLRIDYTWNINYC